MPEDRSESVSESSADAPALSTAASRGEGRVRPPIPPWKRFLLAGSMASVVLGLGLQLLGGSADASSQGEEVAKVSPDASTGQGGPAPTGLVPQPDGFLPGSKPSGTPTDAPGEEPEAEEGVTGWSPFFVKGGFSFFLAFCVGYAARVFFKITALAVGAFALGVFGLSYVGVLDVDWLTIETYYDGFVGRVGAEAKNFKTFMTGSLPSTGLAAFGLFTGFKRG